MIKKSKLLALAILTTFVASTTSAQMTGTVGGRVLDDSGDKISGMTVRATDLLDGSKIYFASSDETGAFRLNDLPVGTYIVAAETLNSSWVQKHDSPVVRISTDPSEITLVLVNLSQLQADDDNNALTYVTLGAAIVGAGAGIASYTKADDAEASALDAEKAAKAAQDAANANGQAIGDLSNTVNDLRNQVNNNSDKLDDLGNKVDDNSQALNDFGNQLNDLGNRVEEIRDSIFR